MFDLNSALSFALILMMFAMGLGLSLHDFMRLLIQPKIMLSTVFVQLLLLPIIAIFIALLLSLPGPSAVGLLLVALCPSGSTSNLFCKVGRGNAALSVSLTAVISVVTVFTLPLALLTVAPWLGYGSSELNLSLWQTVVDLALHTLFPVGIGMLLRQLSYSLVNLIEPWVVLLSSLVFFIVIILLWWQNWSHIVNSFLQAGIASLLMLVAALLSGYAVARLLRVNSRDRFTMMIEVGIQNGALAFFIAVNLLHDVTLLAPATVYTVAMVLVAMPLLFLRLRQESVHEAMGLPH